MKARQYINMMGMAAAVLLSSCVKDTLYDTPHPDHGMIAVTADWSARGTGIDIPATWTVSMGDYTGTETGATHSSDHLFSPGNYTLAAYNIPEGITVSGTTAAVAAADGGFIVNTPGWLFTSVQEVEIEADTDYSLTAVMQQQVRELTLVIEPAGDAADRIEAIEGALSGAAGTLELIFTLLMLQKGVLPPSAGFRKKAEDVPVPPIAEPTEFSGDFALSTSLAFGGCNTALIVGRECAE